MTAGLRIGLLGASRISRGAIIAPAQEIDRVEVSRIAARDPERAKVFAAEHAIPATEPDYRALVTSDDVDLVYNALPPSEHARWTIAALEAGKSVLCEKPFAMNAAEAEAMVAAARQSSQLLIEAFHYRFHPAFAAFLDLIEDTATGDVQRIDAHFNVPIVYQPGELRYVRALGGGAMMDLGCYPVHWVRSVAGSEPDVVSATAEQHATGVDVAMRAELEFPGGVAASVACCMSESLPAGLDAQLRVTGSRGVATMINPLAPQHGHEIVLETADGTSSRQVDAGTTYLHQLQHVVRVVQGIERPITGGDDAVATMRVLDGIYAAAGFGAAETRRG